MLQISGFYKELGKGKKKKRWDGSKIQNYLREWGGLEGELQETGPHLA